MSDAAPIIARFGLSRHPEGGWYRETWRGETGANGRAVGTAILFLLEADQRSHWHRVDAAEIWYWHLGAPLELRIAMTEDAGVATHRLGPDILDDDVPHLLVPPHAWQAARPIGGFTLVSCSVSPGFDFDGFHVAAPDWEPGAVS